ncbi:NADH dehydrogenase-like protein [Dinothrombium tinctorium]|uniref:NADH dehydrogenase [ubiquinone] 1 beta subcomplex subunit 7 n=1 Tax=Dinothrombium tinctorium TaxID=1965070 RepID=A0A3S4R9P3_9ACAR|nr:NADH dehydrogenase-like protein [Dinothrombium tinctorium]
MGNDLTISHKFGAPDSQLESKYDPLFGFPKGRKKREMIATEEELDSAMIEARKRDYCAHKFLKLKACRRDESPFFYKCNHYFHAYMDCLYEDELIRIKEFEREKRLDARQKRILQKMKKEGFSPEANGSNGSN